ncbi:hypothetical protein FQN51_000212 [Onygenales sp. PD_10]|nr:hypothetical protein FQN51_000212 [Onygenales sp. PD_10]
MFTAKNYGVREDLGSRPVDEIWPNLQFAVSPNDDQARAARGEPHQFSIALELQEKSLLIPPSKTLRLPHSIAVSSSTIQPPTGIPYVFLQEIEISFNFSPRYPDHDLNGRPDKIPRSTSFEDLSALINPRDDFFDCIPKSSSGDGIYYSSQSTIQSHDNDWMSLDADSPFSSQQTSSSSHSDIPNNQGSEQQNTSSKPPSGPFLILLNVGFRNLLCEDPSRTASIITTTIEKPGPTLSNFAPSIFCPRYETEIAQRARFIPMISKGLAAMLDMSPSSDLRSKLARINTTPAGQNYSEATTTSEQPADGKSLLKTLLWKSMHRGLYSPETARKLPCLATAPTYKGNRGSSNNIAMQLGALLTGEPNMTTPLHTAISDTECLFQSSTSPPSPSPSFTFTFSDDDLLTDTTNKEEDFIDPFDTPIYPNLNPLSTHQIATATSTVAEPYSPISSLLDDYTDLPLPTSSHTTSFSQNPNFHHHQHQQQQLPTPTAIKANSPTLPSSPLIISSSSDIELLDPSSPVPVPVPASDSVSNETAMTLPTTRLDGGRDRDIMGSDDDLLFNAPVVAGGFVGFGGGDDDDDDDGDWGCGDATVARDVDVDVDVDVEMLLL